MMKRMMISAVLLLWAGSAYADDRANAVMVVAFLQYEEICNAKVPSSLAELAASAMKKLDADLLEATGHGNVGGYRYRGTGKILQITRR